MADFVEPFEGVQDAIVAKLAAQSITCYDYHPIELMPVPSAYLQVSDIVAGAYRMDQGEAMIGSLRYTLRYYVSLEGDERVAHQQAYEGVRKIFLAFGSALMGSGDVRNAQIERTSIDPVSVGADGRPMLLVECELAIVPGQYV